MVKLSEEPLPDGLEGGGRAPPDLEVLAEEIILQRRRVREQARRLGRMIDDLVEDETRVRSALSDMNLTDTERIVLQVIFAEETLGEGERVLLEEFGLRGGIDSIANALAKAKLAKGKKSSPKRRFST